MNVRHRPGDPTAWLSAGAPMPVAVRAGAVIGVVLALVPLLGLVARMPWSRLVSDLRSEAATEALVLSLGTATVAAVVATVGGAPLGWWLSRRTGRAAGLIRAAVVLPLVLPPVVVGVALLAAFGRRGLFGGVLADVGISLPFTTAGVVVAQAVVALPFVVVTVEAAGRRVDRGLEEAAAVAGATPAFTLRHVVLPQLRPAVAAAAVLAWARAFGEFGATVTFAGSLAGTTRTLPLTVIDVLQVDAERALSISLLMVVVSLAVLVGLRGRWVAP